jgi:hypothetical protein
MLKVNFGEIKRKELETTKLKKMSLDAVHAHQLFDAKSLRSLTFGLNDETRIQLHKLEESGPLRRLMIVPNDYPAKCRDLEARFPNFSGYINDYLLPSLALSHVRKSSFQLPPTVFVGSPGVGKTLFVSAVAESFLLDFERVNLETSQASMEFVGTSRGWSKINFMFTANTLEGIPPAVMSRVIAFDVPDLTPLQAKNVAIRQYEDMLNDLNLPIAAPKLTQEGLTLLSSESPRRQRLLLQLAIGSAVYKKSKELVIHKVSKPKKGIGFVI